MKLVWLAYAFLWGAIWGSFINVVIWRLPRGMSLTRPGSHCPHCSSSVRWWHNIPIVGWLVLRGKCADCAAPISARYPLVELLVAVLSAALWLHVTSGRLTDDTLPAALSQFLLHFYFMLILVAITFIDLDLTIIPHRLTFPLMAWGLLAALLSPKAGVWAGYHPQVDIVDSAVGLAVGGLMLYAIFKGYQLVKGIPGGGGGDITLIAVIGANLGWQSLIFVLMASSLQGLAAALIAVAIEKRRGDRAGGGLLLRGAHREEFWEEHPVHGVAASEITQGGDSDEALAGEGGLASEAEAGAARDASHVVATDTELEDEGLMRLAVPFGPFLALAALEYIFFGRWALNLATGGLFP